MLVHTKLETKNQMYAKQVYPGILQWFTQLMFDLICLNKTMFSVNRYFKHAFNFASFSHKKDVSKRCTRY